MATSNRPVSVAVSYWIDGSSTSTRLDEEEPQQKKTFSQEQGSKPARLGLPEGVEATKPSAGDYGYSGMHDHGPLIPPREGGEMAHLIGCVQDAKKFNDEYLTTLIEDEKQQQKSKKAKTTT